MATPRLLRTQGSSMLSCRYRTKQPSSTIVVLHPEGLTVDISDTVTDVTGWDVTGRAVDEPAFVAALLDELGEKVCIDLRQVYAAGY